ncbi:MAG: hypothetical protein CMG39_04700 [Candidatus Marinimicrobia bacterium]|nr:hypothetical protein [Candidatus Neomarinimicrobiota bacterium]|tara:strand:+ start:677 stop:1549 length:873 start_codon:yes stop_codon:yes gene_type:complete
MLINKLKYLIFEGFKILYRSLIPSLISSITIGISLLVLSVSYYLYVNLESFTSDFKNEYKIEVFFDEKLSLDSSLQIFNKILFIDGIEDGVFIDKDTAADLFKNEFNEDVKNIIGQNPLPMGGIFGISDDFRTYDLMSKISKEIKYLDGVDDAIFPEEAVVQFDRTIRNLLSFSFLIGLFIIVASYFFVSNTILLVIYSKKNEINILKLLGANDLFIKVPYIINGVLVGLIGSLVSLVALILLDNISLYVILPYYDFNSANYNFILFFNIFFGIFLGLISSTRSINKIYK